MSRLSTIIKILLSGAIATTILMPGLVSAQSMSESSHHATSDLATCLERHQTPSSSAAKASTQYSEDEEDEPRPPEFPYYLTIQNVEYDQEVARPLLISSPSFIPPDIVILLATLRI